MLGLLWFFWRLYQAPFLLFGACTCCTVLLPWCRTCPARRDCCGCLRVWKVLRRWCHLDQFDDFWLKALVHDFICANNTGFAARSSLAARLSAGSFEVQTKFRKDGLYHETLDALIEQGAANIYIDMVDKRGISVARVQVNTMECIEEIQARGPIDLELSMQPMYKEVHKPTIRVTLAILDPRDGDYTNGDDAFKGSAPALENEDWLIEHFIRRCSVAQECDGGDTTERRDPTDDLLRACAGELELSDGPGHCRKVYAAVVGPPLRRRHALCLWESRKDSYAKDPIHEVDLLKVTCVAPSTGNAVDFSIKFYDTRRVARWLYLRRLDRPRDVWIGLLLRLITCLHQERQGRKNSMALSEGAVPPPEPDEGLKTGAGPASSSSRSFVPSLLRMRRTH